MSKQTRPADEKYKYDLTKPRGRELKGDGKSYKCRTNRCVDCTAMKCSCDCGHGTAGATRSQSKAA